MLESKAYLSAMTALQARVKELESQLIMANEFSIRQSVEKEFEDSMKTQTKLIKELSERSDE